jgi:tetratricopeptide (TPR) repeat protein
MKTPPALVVLALALTAAPAAAAGSRWEDLMDRAALDGFEGKADGAIDGAFAALDEAREAKDQQEERAALRLLDRLCRQAGKPEAWKLAARRLEGLREPDAQIFSELASVRDALGQDAQAEAAYKKAVEKAPSDAQPVLALAALQRRLGRTAEAARVLEGALGSVTLKHPIYLALVQDYLALVRESDAKKAAEAAKNLARENAVVYRNQGYWSLNEEKPAEASRLFESLIEADPEDPYMLHHAGKLELKLGRFAEAATRFAKSLENLKRNGEASPEDLVHTAWHLGLARAALGQTAPAGDAYREALMLGGKALKGKLPWALVEDSLARLSLPWEPTAAEKLYREALAECGSGCSPMSSSILRAGLADSLEAQDRHSEARSQRAAEPIGLSRSYGERYRLVDGLMDAAEKLDAHGEAAAARVVYRQVIATALDEVWPYRDQVPEALRRLAALDAKEGKSSEAEALLREALSLLERRSRYHGMAAKARAEAIARVQQDLAGLKPAR